MSLYKVIIADDEQPIRQGLSSFSWETYGFQLVSAAADGQAALQAIRHHKADILLSDIRMPLLDGLHLAKIVYDQQLATKVILLTGFQDFEYAQQAIRYDVFQLLTKPLVPEDLADCLLRARTQLDKVRKQDETELQREKQYNITDYIATCALLRRYLLGISVTPEESALLQCKTASFQMQFCMLCAISPLTDCKLQNAAFQQNNSLFQEYRFTIGKHCISVLFTTEENQKKVEQIFVSRISLPCCMGSWVNTPQELADSYHQALSISAAEHKVYRWDTNRQIVQSNLLPKQKMAAFSHFLFEKQSVTLTQIDSQLDLFLEELSPFLEYGLTAYQQVLLAFSAELQAQLSRFNDNDGGELLSAVNQAHIMIENGSSAIALNRAIRVMVHHIFNAERSTAGDPNRVLIEKAMHYVRQHYDQPLSLESVADYVHISPSYLSVLFKKYAKINFSKFLRNCRIAQAKERLVTTHDKVYEIATQVGYPNSKYFIDLFKETTGISPHEYRILYGNGGHFS